MRRANFFITEYMQFVLLRLHLQFCENDHLSDKKTGRTKSAVIRYYVSKLNQESATKLLKRKIERISPGKGKLISKLIREMRA